jgi:hypothetical protein
MEDPIVLDDTLTVTEDQPVEDKVKVLEEQNKKLYARAKEAEAKLKEKSVEKPIINNPSPTSAMDILRDDAFKLYREGYDEKEIDAIMNNGGRKILEDKDNPVTLGIIARKEQRHAEEQGSKVQGSSQLSEVERKYTPEQLQNMTAAELAKILPHNS